MAQKDRFNSPGRCIPPGCAGSRAACRPDPSRPGSATRCAKAASFSISFLPDVCPEPVFLKGSLVERNGAEKGGAIVPGAAGAAVVVAPSSGVVSDRDPKPAVRACPAARGHRVVTLRTRQYHRERASRLSFPYVRPEPVLGKMIVFIYKGLKKGVSHLRPETQQGDLLLASRNVIETAEWRCDLRKNASHLLEFSLRLSRASALVKRSFLHYNMAHGSKRAFNLATVGATAAKRWARV